MGNIGYRLITVLHAKWLRIHEFPCILTVSTDGPQPEERPDAKLILFALEVRNRDFQRLRPVMVLEVLDFVNPWD